MAHHALYTQFITHPGKGTDLVTLLKKANDIVSTASGCKLYIINVHATDEDCIWVTELWDSEESHAISLTMDGCKELVTEAATLLSLPPKQIVLKALAGKGS
ncbi:putative quinol monooxygenase [Sediminibacterium soli]|uniref:putative quinol monooxygenase n=1 Tax=Sediminibacterium soli TaxID=2698829 RepID=UPI0013796587|nr:antibiotic biosynthesis monooxygenase [Sediminibacterium soli]NCI45292.1 antibiotic biosynthesis monooxygenase [Sediminibacterium soli]